MNDVVLSQILDLDNLFVKDKFYFGRNYNRGNVLKPGDKYYHGVCLGIIFSWTHGQEYTISGASKQPKYANLLKKSMNLINTFDPEFKCSTIQFNKNYRIAKHIDGNNVGESYIIGLGSYVGGELIVFDKDDNPTYVDINHKFYKFNGSEYYHQVADFIGERITLVFFFLGEEGKIIKKK
tara:strand:+ start:443 stop:982 length:540 start_codon:yes stop_codon:yes gene_type:complete